MNLQQFSAFERNQQGLMTKTQQDFLIRCFIKEFLFWSIWGGCFVLVSLLNHWAFILFTLAIFGLGLIRLIYAYLTELLQLPAPRLIIGTVHKFPFPQSRTWWVGVNNHFVLRCDAKLWSRLENKGQYEIFYTQKSRWILSYRRVGGTSDSAN
jgi:hypothetical protein